MRKVKGAVDTRKLVLISVLVAQGMVLGYIEKMLPIPFIVPGAKLGLANIITLTAIYFLNFKESSAVVLLRVFLTAATFGSLSSFLYSLSGGVLSLIAMAGLLKVFKDELSLISISIIGSISHNMGQLIVAAIIIHNVLILTYLPFLLIIAIPTGIFVGIVARALIQYLQKTNFIR
ncbi:Gx transporter family protein [Fusibacter ferrireducens]|uniref:Gx transporter family protein n=1 Tax=Fusibacter ferrireducens TaxID=2785058 RepID=A0ABR9ZWF8_9FIRM|nr:Gx transporter family protein [Fusibacter ferrireducens]MBF4694787.1 Gx transporter family protein [Fusibacter ferrireducens]